MKKVHHLLLILVFLLCSCTPVPLPAPVDRYAQLPTVKYGPETDAWVPVAAAGWSKPVPLPFPVNTSGGEDSPFLMPDGNTLYFFFTPDVSIPAEKQLNDGLTGIWVTQRQGEAWSEPQRVLLSPPEKLALDGCQFVTDTEMYFCSAREGYNGINWFHADLVEGRWQGVRYAGDELKQQEYEVGELHISSDGQEMYFHSARSGGIGGLDVWMSSMTAEGWGEPINPGSHINTSYDEGWPYLSPDGQELWFLGRSQKGGVGPAIFRSLRQLDGSWGQAQEIITNFAGEPALSSDGHTLYFVHHYFSQDLATMLEADIYVSRRIDP